MDNHNCTALMFAIDFDPKCSSTIDILARLTTKGLGGALRKLALWHTEVTPAVEDLLRRAASDEDAVKRGVGTAAQYGATRILKILTLDTKKNSSSFETQFCNVYRNNFTNNYI